MRLFFDTNVIIDVLLKREGFFEDSSSVMRLVDRDIGVVGALSANTLTDIHYILRKGLSKEVLIKSMHDLMELMEVVSVTRAECAIALDSDMPDFEDALLAVCAYQWEADYIITRDTGDFKNSPVPALAPSDFLSKIWADRSE